MKREHSKKEKPSSDLILSLPLDGNIIDSVSGVDLETMYGWPNSSFRSYTFVNDPTGIGGKGIRRSQTLGGRNNLQSIPTFIVDPRNFREDIPTLFKPFSQCESSAYSASIWSFLIGLSLEFEVYILPQTGDRYILESYDGLYGQNYQMYGVEIYRNNLQVFVKTTSENYTLYTLSNNTWYRFKMDFIEVSSSQYKVIVNLFDLNDNLLASHATPNIIKGNNNKNSRSLYFFNSAYGYFTTAANMQDLLRNVKVKYQ